MTGVCARIHRNKSNALARKSADAGAADVRGAARSARLAHHLAHAAGELAAAAVVGLAAVEAQLDAGVGPAGAATTAAATAGSATRPRAAAVAGDALAELTHQARAADVAA